MGSLLSRLANRRRPALLVAGTLAAVVLGATALFAGLVVTVATLAGVLAPGVAFPALLVALVVVVLAGLGTALGSAGIAWTTLSRLRDAAGTARRRLSWHLYRGARRLEQRDGLGASLQPTRLFEGRREDDPLVAELKRRYVAGDLDELAYERELARLLGGADGRPERSGSRPDTRSGRETERDGSGVAATVPEGRSPADGDGPATDGDGPATDGDAPPTDGDGHVSPDGTGPSVGDGQAGESGDRSTADGAARDDEREREPE